MADGEVDAYTATLVERLQAVLGNALEGVYIIGSLALGGFVPGQSDIDVLAVANPRPAPTMRRRIVEALTHPYLECPTRGLEFVLYDRRAVASPSPRSAFDINLNTGPRMDFHASFDPAEEPAHWFVVDRSIARSNAIRLYGPPPAELIAEIPRRWVMSSLLDMLEWHRMNEPSGPNIVLNACRSWRFVEEGVWSSKVDGASWAKGRGAHPMLIDAAVARRAGEDAPVVVSSHEDALVRRVEQAVAAALEQG